MVVVAQPQDNGTQQSVFLLDPHQAAREGLAYRLQASGYRIKGEAGSVVGALQAIATALPDLVVMEVAMKDGSGMELVKRIVGNCPSIHILVWSRYRETVFAERAIRCGALGYIEKEQPTSTVVEAVRRVGSGKIYLSPAMTETMLRQGTSKNNGIASDPVEELSDRELEVFRMIGMSRDTELIAKELHLSQKTVETYRSRIKTKFGTDSSAELLRLAIYWELQNG